MPRYKLTIEYDGTDFWGWQRQDEGFSVQQVLEDAIFKYCGEEARLHVAGRTDSGVHATGQVAHVDLDRADTPYRVMGAINFHVRPHAVAIVAAEIVPGAEAGRDGAFHARFGATARQYRYRIINRRSPLALDRNRAWWVPVPLDADAMHQAAQVLVGHHDFTSFRASQCQADSPMRTLDLLDVHREGDDIYISVKARSFLHHQVRNIVGTLKMVGEGKWTAIDVKDALEARNRAAGGETAPACGLFLVKVTY